MSPRLSKLIRVFLISLLILVGVSTYQFLHDRQRTNLIKNHRFNIPAIAETALRQVLRQRGLIRLTGIVHSASSTPASKNSSTNCYSRHLTASLEGEKASVTLLDLHNCSELHKDQDCLAGGQICISFENSKIDDVFITFDLMNEQCGEFSIILPSQQKLQREIQHAFEQLTNTSRMADRETLNAMLYDLFSNDEQRPASDEVGQEFLETLLGAFHHYLSSVNVFD